VHYEVVCVGEGLEGDTTVSGNTVDDLEGGGISVSINSGNSETSFSGGHEHIIWSSETDTMLGFREWVFNHPDGLDSTDR
jgi:hypothetical protein